MDNENEFWTSFLKVNILIIDYLIIILKFVKKLFVIYLIVAVFEYFQRIYLWYIVQIYVYSQINSWAISFNKNRWLFLIISLLTLDYKVKSENFIQKTQIWQILWSN